MGKQNSREVADAFAKDVVAKGDSNGALSYASNYAYSYAAVIAVKLGGKRAVVTTHKYSVTTSKHTTLIAGALAREGWKLYYIDLNSLGIPVKCEGQEFKGFDALLSEMDKAGDNSPFKRK
jgi:hypothetical protein